MVITKQPRTKRWAPCGKRENWQDYYFVREASADYSDYWGEKIDPDGNVRQRNTEEERQQFLADNADQIKFINDLLPVSVLDFGAGLGWMLSAIEASYKVALEIAPEAIACLHESALIVYRNIQELPSNAFDVVICNHVIEHLPDPIEAVGQMRRVLHKDGWLVLSTPDFGSPCAERFGENYRLLHDKTHCSLFTLEGLMRLLRDKAFNIHRVSFPFPERYATAENFMRWKDTTKVSPPWPGNFLEVRAVRS